MYIIENLEIHATNLCNLKCKGCSHFSNHNCGEEHIDPNVASQWMDAWNNRLFPKEINILGGEPTLNPNLFDFLKITRKKWPKSIINLITNGTLLRHDSDLPKILQDNKINLYISKYNQQQYEKIEKITKCWPIKINWLFSLEKWTHYYQLTGNNMIPLASNDAKSSWNNCSAKKCLQLFNFKLWKCPLVTYINVISPFYTLHSSWKSTLDYQPLNSSCSDDELIFFLKKREEHCCSNCPITKKNALHL